MKNYKKLIVGSIMTAIMVVSPAMSFADNDKDKGRGEEKREDKKEQKENQREERSEERNNKFNNWFSSGWFNGKGPKVAISVPVISDLIVSSNKGSKATLKWNTDVRSNSFVWYSTTSPVDTSLSPNMKRNDRVLKHKFEIKKLQPNTKYYVIVGGANNKGMVKSSVVSFTTGAVITNASVPVITSVVGPATIKTGETASVTINAYDPQSKILTYGTDWGDGNTTTQLAFTGSVTVTHVYNIVGTYVAKFTITNSDGKKVTYPMKIVVTAVATTDTTAPVISGVTTTVTGSITTVSWTTNEPATSNVFYSIGTPVDVNAILTPKVVSGTLTTNHSLSIPSLLSSTLYHFIIKSADSSNNVAVSSEATFATN
ncbi:MAG: hypothetical protein UR85_C0004G0071 [Candidatus Nomurabacteria bacterium GW2011_GWF2_35_66]|uniref:PKD domain-containing protein n=1 Tax=Candidatus Nomurabacteria bacterium GW2011_GWE1_35_16 TaxID=1618761 RepID=A0A0G0BSZ4_9BACT|nr:MAG: hypothetical protein UR55_C0002G0070 [Candidatus Nomurabacteria bacterium GW2011_GWF1_34_20]KKP63649.1 MAG: hypothetical protein UR57_C0002G0070 [Candidatus Nomurabacteria bacterium GW2011_GWE2_34_25]KKP66851.1 MAG: hypothetical protein UR64_C0002G0067 [Candidatus Nomurabacteria bacterium GW2011_GWE1_35_16]KKP83477.1 MAG: hypothetical protein UR85_C0004G0071 [Candidatus Nomurabacteria bacterium GW2011_GWF2_35_66]HAE36591.1 hypothetical protein [Candidatus Nomurabacteria bacterium]